MGEGGFDFTAGELIGCADYWQGCWKMTRFAAARYGVRWVKAGRGSGWGRQALQAEDSVSTAVDGQDKDTALQTRYLWPGRKLREFMLRDAKVTHREEGEMVEPEVWEAWQALGKYL